MGFRCCSFGKCIFNLMISCHLVCMERSCEPESFFTTCQASCFPLKIGFSPNWLYFLTANVDIQDWLSGIKTVFDIRHPLVSWCCKKRWIRKSPVLLLRLNKSEAGIMMQGQIMWCVHNTTITKLELGFCDIIIRIKSIFIDSYNDSEA